MKNIKLFIYLTILMQSSGCMPFDKIYSHDFSSGYFKLKTSGAGIQNVYLNLDGDSVRVYPVSGEGRSMLPDTGTCRLISIKSIKPGSYLYNSTFIKTSVDMDLSTIILKFRPEMKNVPSQLSANVNGVFYAGFRKDFYKLKSEYTYLNKINTFLRHTAFDFGLFAGIGTTPVNPTVTMNKISQEYDGISFQKGVSLFATFENMSVGLALGFDNLLDYNKRNWIYNQKPWLGIVLGIANF